MNNIRRSLVKKRTPPPPSKTPEVFNLISIKTVLEKQMEVSQTIPKGLNVNNIRRSLVKKRTPPPPSKTPEVFNLIRSGETP